MIRNREGKMVVLLATALALSVGVGTVAAYVVPWLYCKPRDADEDRETSEIHKSTDPGPESRSVIEESCASDPRIRIIGFKNIRVSDRSTSSTNIHSTVSTITTQDSRAQNVYCQENPSIVEARHSSQALNAKANVQPSGDTDPMTSGLRHSESIQIDGRNAESTRNSGNSEVLMSISTVTQPSGSEIGNSGISNTRLCNSSTSKVRLPRTNEGNVFATLPITETSNPIDESCIEPANGTLSATTTEVEETHSTTLTTSDRLNPMDESSTERTTKILKSQESENLSLGPTRVLTNAIVESSRISDNLETIREVSTSPAPSVEPSTKVPQQLDYSLPRNNRKSNQWTCNEGSITSTSTQASNRMSFRPALPNGTPSIPGTPDSTQSTLNKRQDAEIKKTSRSFRYAHAVAGRMKKILRGIKMNATPRFAPSENEKESHIDFVKSLSSDNKLSPRHSTLISEEQHLVQSIRTRKSPRTLKTCTLKIFEDPGITINDNMNYVYQFGIEFNEEPLDSSIRSSPHYTKEKIRDTFTEPKSLRRATEYLKALKSFKSIEEGVGVSDSSMHSDKRPKTCMEDENQNVRSNFSNSGNVKVEETGGSTTEFVADKLESGCLPKSNGLSQRIKSIFHVGSNNRNKGNKVLSSLRKGQVFNSAPIEFQRNSAGTSSQLKTELNDKIIGTPDSPTDVSSYFELGITASDDERCLEVPSTHL